MSKTLPTLVQCTRTMRLQIVHHQRNLLRLAIPFGNPGWKPRLLRLRAPLCNPAHALTRQRLERHEYVARPHTAILIVLSFSLPHHHRQRRAHLTDQLARRLIHAHHRAIRIIRPPVNIQHLFHCRLNFRIAVRRYHPLHTSPWLDLLISIQN